MIPVFRPIDTEGNYGSDSAVIAIKINNEQRAPYLPNVPDFICFKFRSRLAPIKESNLVFISIKALVAIVGSIIIVYPIGIIFTSQATAEKKNALSFVALKYV
jgi:hypothetical protein